MKNAKTHLISIAVANFNENNIDNISNVIQDSTDIVNVLTERYKIDLHCKLHNESVTEKAINQAFATLEVTPNDTLIIYCTGHSAIQENSNQLYFPLTNSTIEQFHTYYNYANLFLEIEKLDIKNVLVIVNTCFSGNLGKQRYLHNQNQNTYSTQKSRILFTSTSAGQQADIYSNDSTKNTPFAVPLLYLLKENNEYELQFSKIFDIVNAKFTQEENYASSPQQYQFKGHDDGQISLYLRKDDAIEWANAIQSDDIKIYQTYLKISSNKENKETAKKRISVLKKEEQDWLNYLKTASEALNLFINENQNTIPQSKRVLQAILDLEKIEKEKNNIQNNKSAEEKWNKVKNSRLKRDFEYFEDEFSNQPYWVNKSKIHWNNVENDKREEDDWNNIPNKKTSAANRKARYAEYISNHPFGKNVDNAIENKNGLILWIEIENLELSNDRLAYKNKLENYIKQ